MQAVPVKTVPSTTTSYFHLSNKDKYQLASEEGEKRGSPRRMERLRRSFRDSFRRRKEHIPEAAKPHLWQADELAVRAGTCTFQVKYLGCVEVFESRGMQVCEEALKVLRNSRRRPIKAVLFVSGDGLRVVEDETKGLIVDQTIEKVSFCAPDRNNDKGFSYICRDGTTRRWMCHGFLALKESGERLSHAVGCAFAACLERKQKREKEVGVTMNFDPTNATFTRQGSFRQQSLTEKLANEKNNIITVPTTEAPSAPPVAKVNAMTTIAMVPPVTTTTTTTSTKPAAPNPHAIERPHATVSMLMRQGSFRGFNHLNQASPFKRQLSLRISDLPSNVERARSLSLESSSDPRVPPTQAPPLIHLKTPVSPIPETSPINDRITDPVSAMCQQLSQGLQMLTNAEDFQPQNSLWEGSVVKELFPDSTTTTTTSVTLATSNVAEFSISSLTNDFLAKIDSLKYNTLNNNHNNNNHSNDSDVVLTPPATPPSSVTQAPAGVIVPAAELPKPEQWLGKVSSSVRRPPSLAHSRAMSVDTYFNPDHPDPFNADWAQTQQANPPAPARNTNPFLTNSNNSTPVKAFEVQM